MDNEMLAIHLGQLERKYRRCRCTRHQITVAMEWAQGLQAAAQQRNNGNLVISPSEWARLQKVEDLRNHQ
jgi:hypothetical protein